MREFINEFGRENFTIIAIVVLVILVALVLIVILEKTQIKKSIKKRAKMMLKIDKQIKSTEKKPRENEHNRKKETIDHRTIDALKNIENLEDTIKEIKPQKTPVISTSAPKKEIRPSIPKTENIIHQKPEKKREFDYSRLEHNNLVNNSEKNEVVYKKNKRSVEEAKEKLEEVTKKLIENKEEPNHTFFEEEQEEKSIISYEELVKASHDIDEKNDKLLEDEKDAAITLDELYKAKEKPQVPKRSERLENFKRRNSVVSPIYGRNNDAAITDYNRKDYSSIREEDSEAFLENLKNLRSKLD